MHAQFCGYSVDFGWTEISQLLFILIELGNKRSFGGSGHFGQMKFTRRNIIWDRN